MIEYNFDKNLNDVATINPYVFYDHRGCYVETFNKKDYSAFKEQSGEAIEFVQDDISVSHKNTLRGLHGDHVTWKLVQCLAGSILLAVVDMRKKSDSYLSWKTFLLNDKNRTQILIPPGFANGHLCLSDTCIFSYKQSTYYEGQEKQFTVKWNEPSVGIFWPIDNPTLSYRDSNASYLENEE